MPILHALLASYYLCDAAASENFLDRATIARCIGVYQAVKAEFLDEHELAALQADPLRFGGEQGKVAYLRFSRWEQTNAAFVARMKSEAEARLRREVAAAF